MLPYFSVMKAWSVLLWLSLPVMGLAQSVARLDSLFGMMAREGRLYGQVCLTQNGHTVYQRAFGDAGIGIPLKVSDRLHIGSISKTFTAVMVLQLVEEGKLKLTDRLVRYFPQLPNADSITIDQLLRHRSGLFNLTAMPGYLPWAYEKHSKKEILKLLSKQSSLFAPGSTALYSNTNFLLLGWILEEITGKDYAWNLQDRIARPLGLTHLLFAQTVAPDQGEAASFKADYTLSRHTFPTLPGGAGAISCTAHDLCEFFTALFQFRFLKPEQVAYMKRMQDGYGAGLLEMPFQQKLILGHNGAIDEFRAVAGFAPDSLMSFALLSNLNSDEMNEVLILLLNDFYGNSWKMPTAIALMNESQLAQISGNYATPELPIEIKLFGSKGRLIAQATNQDPIPLIPTDEPDRYRYQMADVMINLKRDNAGKVIGFRFRQGSGDFDFKRK